MLITLYDFNAFFQKEPFLKLHFKDKVFASHIVQNEVAMNILKEVGFIKGIV
jgi:hypothetical protein